MGFALSFKRPCVAVSLLPPPPSPWGPGGGCLRWPMAKCIVQTGAQLENAVKGNQGGSSPQLKSLSLVVLLSELEFTH